MKKFLLALMLLTAVSAVAAKKAPATKAQYPDGTYRGVYISNQETQVEVPSG